VRSSRIGTTQTSHSNNVCGVLNLLGCWLFLHTSILAVTTDIQGVFRTRLNNKYITKATSPDPPLEGRSVQICLILSILVFG